MVKHKLLLLLVLISLSLLLPFTVLAQAVADCDETPNAAGGQDITCEGDHPGVVNGSNGSDEIVNNGTIDGYIWSGIIGAVSDTQNDTIINNGTVGDGEVNEYTGFDDDGIWGAAGNDTIINNGTVNGGAVGAIFGDDLDGNGDDDTIINNGTSNGDINGDVGGAGNDTIIINGTVNGSVYGDASELLIPFGGTADGGNDTVELQNNAVITGTIFGGLGFDILSFAFEVVEWTIFTQLSDLIAAANPMVG
ncbi:MAG: hypothetical protein JNJ61_06540, partial [Anaerolineae bacterium]|nr:hypothetical protein [Anaerolineae bacterium]